MCGVIISVEQCALCASSTHDVHHAIVGVNVVIGVLVVHCELLVVRVVPLVVCDDAVVRRTLVLIAAIFHRILLYWRYIVYRSAATTCPWPPWTSASYTPRNAVWHLKNPKKPGNSSIFRPLPVPLWNIRQ